MIDLQPIGYVRSSCERIARRRLGWRDRAIELAAEFGPEVLEGLEKFSHAEVLFHFDRVEESSIARGSRHPARQPRLAAGGHFAQRAKDRPNRLGSTIVEIKSREGRILRVAGLDAVDGTPVVDIKPVMKEFLPRCPVRQPAWSEELMRILESERRGVSPHLPNNNPPA